MYKYINNDIIGLNDIILECIYVKFFLGDKILSVDILLEGANAKIILYI